jgi:hypothetical protein
MFLQKFEVVYGFGLELLGSLVEKKSYKPIVIHREAKDFCQGACILKCLNQKNIHG